MFAALTLLWSGLVAAAPVTMQDCRARQDVARKHDGPLAYSSAILWKVSRSGHQANYIFGTIHVSDPRISNLPQPVHEAINNAHVFVMEALPDPEEARKLARMMYFDDGKRLHDYLDDDLFRRTTGILNNYRLASDSINLLKPWAAFIIMSYPRADGMPLDLELLDIAHTNGMETRGLETLSEQGRVFSSMDLPSQVQLLLDTLCNYDTINSEFETMKSLYLKRDLQSLYDYSERFSYPGDKLYDDLYKRLLYDRNLRMVERMQPVLAQGQAFIAIGAMHLPGDKGVLSLLAKQGYTITPVY